jgi:hypothetical protein
MGLGETMTSLDLMRDHLCYAVACGFEKCRNYKVIPAKMVDTEMDWPYEKLIDPSDVPELDGWLIRFDPNMVRCPEHRKYVDAALGVLNDGGMKA